MLLTSILLQLDVWLAKYVCIISIFVVRSYSIKERQSKKELPQLQLELRFLQSARQLKLQQTFQEMF